MEFKWVIPSNHVLFVFASLSFFLILVFLQSFFCVGSWLYELNTLVSAHRFRGDIRQSQRLNHRRTNTNNFKGKIQVQFPGEVTKKKGRNQLKRYGLPLSIFLLLTRVSFFFFFSFPLFFLARFLSNFSLVQFSSCFPVCWLLFCNVSG